MQFESDVVDAVCARLQAEGYEIRQRLSTTQQGDDIVATKRVPAAVKLLVEAKGATSSRKGSERYGKPFDSAQIRIHVAEALYKAAEMLSRVTGEAGVRVGIALPDNPGHRTALQRIEPVVTRLGIAVFWVQEDGTVQVVSPWAI